MKIIAPVSSLILLATSALSAVDVTVSYDNTYDASYGSLTTVACSNGDYGLLTRNFTTFGSLPSFPNIGGAAAVAGWNSPSCGTCWALTFNGTTVNVLAIDSAWSGFNIAQSAMDTLTHGQAVALGRIEASAVELTAIACGL